MSDDTTLAKLTAQVVAAYAGKNPVPAAEVAVLIQTVRSALKMVGEPPVELASSAAPLRKLTAAQIKRSISAEALISFEDGQSYKQLKRHLAGRGLSPAQYRAKWGLPADYPMVAAKLSAARSAVAKASGLGRKAPPRPARRPMTKTVQAQPVAEAVPETTPLVAVEPASEARRPKARIFGKLSLFGRRNSSTEPEVAPENGDAAQTD